MESGIIKGKRKWEWEKIKRLREREGEVESIREWGNKKYNKMWKEKKREALERENMRKE